MALGPEEKRLVKATSQMGRAGLEDNVELSQGSLCTAENLPVRRGMKLQEWTLSTGSTYDTYTVLNCQDLQGAEHRAH